MVIHTNLMYLWDIFLLAFFQPHCNPLQSCSIKPITICGLANPDHQMEAAYNLFGYIIVYLAAAGHQENIIAHLNNMYL